MTGDDVAVVVDVLSWGFGSGTPAGVATVAVLESVVSAAIVELGVAVTRNVAVPPLARLIAAAMLPLPDAGPLEPVPV